MTPDGLHYYPAAPRESIGRYCALEGITEIKNLKAGMDFRHPQHRREVWLRFYEFHLKYRAHPGCVYFLFPYFFEKYDMTEEQRLWLCFINGNTQHPPSTWTIFKRFPDFAWLNVTKLDTWFNANFTKLGWDTDRRHHKSQFMASVRCYKALCGKSQSRYFSDVIADAANEEAAFRNVWTAVREKFWSFGRLSTFSYLEYLRIAGMPLDCDDLLLEDMSGSKSHRNGLAKVLGRDDLDWRRDGEFHGTYAPGQVDWLKSEAAQLRKEARARFKDRDFIRDVGYFTMESTFCTYKSWHRKNRRYPGVYADMLHRRLQLAERAMPAEDYSDFWDARRKCLPAHLRLEDTPGDSGMCPEKSNHYRNTGQVIMMDHDWPCFKNDFRAAHL
jgi:hypothetical protein